MESVFSTNVVATSFWSGFFTSLIFYVLLGLALIGGLYFAFLRKEKKCTSRMLRTLVITYCVSALFTALFTFIFPFYYYSWSALDWIFSATVILSAVLLTYLIVTRECKLPFKRYFVISTISTICISLLIVALVYGKYAYYSFQNESDRARFYINELGTNKKHRVLNAAQNLLNNKSVSIGLMLQTLSSSDDFALNKKIEILLGHVGPDLIPELHNIALDFKHPAYNSAIKLLLKFSKPESWDVLAKSLDATEQLSAPTRDRILMLIHKINAKKTLPYLYKQIQSPDESLKSTAAKLLGEYPAYKKSVALLNLALKDKSSAVCEYAADSLGKIKSKTSTTALLEAIRTRTDCDNALRALAELRVRDAVPYLIARYKRAKTETTKIIMLINLGKVEDKRAMPLLEEALNSESEAIREAAKNAIQQIKTANEVGIPAPEKKVPAATKPKSKLKPNKI